MLLFLMRYGCRLWFWYFCRARFDCTQWRKKDVCALLAFVPREITIIREFTYMKFKCTNNNNCTRKSHTLKSLHCAIFAFVTNQNTFIFLLRRYHHFVVACEFCLFYKLILHYKKTRLFFFSTFRQFCYSHPFKIACRDTFAVAILLKSILFAHTVALMVA